jgi:hypothetical protein
VLSPFLFLVYCSEINFDNVLGCKLYIYADYIALASTSSHQITLKSCIQKGLGHLEMWASNNNMDFPPSKSALMLFSRKKNIAPPMVSIYSMIIPYVERFSYFGLVIDRKISWNHHINYLVGSLKNKANLINAISINMYKSTGKNQLS